jgi:hypothetical protein
MQPSTVVVHEVRATIAAWLSILFLKALVRRVNRRIDIASGRARPRRA